MVRLMQQELVEIYKWLVFRLLVDERIAVESVILFTARANAAVWVALC